MILDIRSIGYQHYIAKSIRYYSILLSTSNNMYFSVAGKNLEVI